MTREEAIKILKIKKDCFDCEGLSCSLDGKLYEGCETCSEAIDMAIEALEAKEKCDKLLDMCWDKILDDYPRWIPVSERLPDKDIPDPYVLISCWSEADDYFVQEAYAYRDASDVICFDSLYSKDKVLAWMPLPKPYKEGEQE